MSVTGWNSAEREVSRMTPRFLAQQSAWIVGLACGGPNNSPKYVHVNLHN